jgi:D-glycero-D-manno-heptose 1,7-bisphosphate phosphatase
MMRPAVFIDKDGTLVRDVPYNVDPARIRLTPGAGPALKLLQESGFALIVITNQPGVGEGRFAAAALERVRARIETLLEPHAVTLDGFYFCPHVAAGGAASCPCRKPKPGLLYRAALEHGIDLRRSWMVGDILNDIEAGRRAGCRTALIDCGNETEWLLAPWRMPDLVATNLGTAARLIAQVARQEMPAPAELVE